ncbi:MBL fold metallo-hydrolase [Bacillus sp. BRMEA1]|uniref:MBL fold metallo-hydrolase n=1 Tax=Neobacillus endophyticus TaxID=2738405 RepID=UPI00156446C7|nr:MBL fold metallo-hydrolase [Neobacillus endophyticus]NRD79224.1 MBL fold metallo-hydrolase [Neobacillus endophyticus]
MDHEMTYGSDYKYIPATSIGSGVGMNVLPDVYCYTIQIVNICLVGHPDGSDFVLVDTGMPNSANEIISVVEDRFGINSRPRAILLTHGHFDHVGSIIELVNHWNIPVYAHELELPYLTGKRSYPKPDPTVEGGMVAKLSSLFPNEPIDLGSHVKLLPSNGNVPFLPEFRWIHTPGHTPGHVSFFRETDRLLIAGDAFITVRQDALLKVISQEQEISGPPRYFTTDWGQAWESVKKLAALNPEEAVTGHGLPISGPLLTNGLQKLAAEFNHLAIPDYGRYVNKNSH